MDEFTMNRRQFVWIAGMGPGLAHASQEGKGLPPPAEPKERQPESPVVRAPLSPLRIGTSAQLFVERSIVRETDRVWFTLHPGEKHPRNPVIRADRDWEGWRVRNKGNAIFDEDEKIFKMWYGADVARNYFEPVHNYSLCAVSKDGVEWEKPLVGTIHSPILGFRHNVVIQGEHACVTKDYDEPDGARRYKAVFSITPGQAEPRHPKHAFVSSDGLHWSRFSSKPLVDGVGDVTIAYYDEHGRLWVMFIKKEIVLRGQMRRCFWLMTSRDFVHWREPQLVFVPDYDDDVGSMRRIEEVRPLLNVPDNPALVRTEFYGVGAYAAESCTVAFPWIFTVNNRGRYGSVDGPIEIQLAASRDLVDWQRHFRLPIVPRGRVGEWDPGLFYTQCKAIRYNDEIWLYYSASNSAHGDANHPDNDYQRERTSSIGLVKWKLDRFVSADAGAEGGVLTTEPFTHAGSHLELNARVGPGGGIRAEFLDAAGRPIQERGRSAPCTGDRLRSRVAWTGNEQITQRLKGKPVRLSFELRSTEVYSLAFRS